jgi:hypothetical protein
MTEQPGQLPAVQLTRKGSATFSFPTLANVWRFICCAPTALAKKTKLVSMNIIFFIAQKGISNAIVFKKTPPQYKEGIFFKKSVFGLKNEFSKVNRKYFLRNYCYFLSK